VIPEEPTTPSFRDRVFEVVLRIPEGRVTTYGAIARYLGAPRSARMVGWAMASCPDDVSEVAHRVVNRFGELSGGWAWGHPEAMRALLVEERVRFKDRYTVDLSACFWDPQSQHECTNAGVYSERAREE
jgi:methylated-DNA-protein-cysteine methyltransferase-like protein